MEGYRVNIKMFDRSSSYKRNNKPSSIAIMREFYKDYSRMQKPKSRSDASFGSKENRKSSITKFTTYLKNMGNVEGVMT